MSPYALLVSAIVHLEQALESLPSEFQSEVARIRKETTAIAIAINQPGAQDQDAYVQLMMHLLPRLGITLEVMGKAEEIAKRRMAGETQPPLSDDSVARTASVLSGDLAALILDSATKSSNNRDTNLWERVAAIKRGVSEDGNT